MKSFKILFYIFLICVLALNLSFSVFALTEYFLVDSGRISPVPIDGFCYAVIVVNATFILLIPLYFYLKKRSFYENRSKS